MRGQALNNPAANALVLAMRCSGMSCINQLSDTCVGQRIVARQRAFANLAVLLIIALATCVVVALATPGLTPAQIFSCLVLAGVPTGLPILAYARGILAQAAEGK